MNLSTIHSFDAQKLKKSFSNKSKFFFLFPFLMLSLFNLEAKNYYFSSSTGSDSYTSTQAQNQATPWQTITKLNSLLTSILPGDYIYFKRGDVFFGSIVLSVSGNSASSITFGAYGTGNKPIISGLITASTWTSLGNNIYQCPVASVKSNLNMVSIDGVPQRLGRFPNYTSTGDPYLYYETFTKNGNTGTITDNELTTATNWTGAEVVIKKKRWILDRCKITAHSGGTLTYYDSTGSSYQGINGFGYFIQNDSRTLDQFGEWFLNKSTKNLQVHFGGNLPANYSVKVSAVDVLLNLGANSYITVTDLAFEGANIAALNAQYGSNITIQQCDFTQMGTDAIDIEGSPNALLENLNLSYILNNPIKIANVGYTNSIVRNCSIKNCSLYAGMGGNADGNYQAISVQVTSGATLEYNSIDTVGYTAIDFQGNDISIHNNFINTYCAVKDDGGGIYTWGIGLDVTKSYSNRKVYSNVVLNAKGEPYGTTGKTAEAKGIYLDGGSMNVDIYDNSIAHIGRTAILLNNSYGVKILGNTIYNARFGVEMVRLEKTFQVRNIEMKRNIIYPILASQSNIYYKNFFLATPTPLTIEQDMKLLGKFDSNYHATTSDIGFSYYTCQDYATNQTLTISPGYTLETWKTLIGGDATTRSPARTATSTSQLRFEYNATSVAKTIVLDAKYAGVDSTIYDGSITLQPYTSKVLVNIGAASPTGSPLKATVTAPSAINCSAVNSTITVAASGGSSPYTGTGSFSANAGRGTLKISFPTSDATKSSSIFASVGTITSGKTYVLSFTTLGAATTGQLACSIKQNASPNALLATQQTKTFGTTRVDHKIIFTATATDATGRFEIAIAQSSGTTYVDNISFFEANTAGDLISSNLFALASGQFETNIAGVSVSSSNNNQVVAWDTTGKINNTHYYTVTDAAGAKSTVGITIAQPGIVLTATAVAGTIAVNGGTTTVTVTATGGALPYSGIGTFTKGAGSSSFTVTDANGCTTSTAINITQPGSATPLVATAVATAINCSANSSTITVAATGGTSPYTGTGDISTNAGVGSLKLSFPTSNASISTVLFASVGAIVSGKTYVLNFTTLGVASTGKLVASLRQTASPNNLLSAQQSKTFGTTIVDHEVIFTATSSDANARFDIAINQASGTTYIDNIAFFESNTNGDVIGSNLYPASFGLFETGITGISIWSSNSNQLAEWDNTAKINNTYYYTVTDAAGVKSTAIVTSAQPAVALISAASAGTITVNGGTTTVTVSATGGTAPYTGTGTFTKGAGSSSFTVTDAKGCTSTITINITQPAVSTPLTAAASVGSINCSGTTHAITVSATGGATPYTGTGSFSANAGVGSLKLSFPTSNASISTVLFASVGAIVSGKTYTLNFSTLGTSASGKFVASLRQTTSPNTLLATQQTITFGTTRVDHEIQFTATASDANGRFDISINQASGTTYIDNIAFFETNVAGDLIGANLFPASSGQFETGIAGVSVWSSNSNQLAEWDVTAKINSTHYYTVTDAAGTKSSIGATSSQPATALLAASVAGTINVFGGTTTVTVSATGGAAPYAGTGSFTRSAGTSTFTVTDANGCTSNTSVTITQPAATSLTAIATAAAINCATTSNTITVTASGGTTPYAGTGTYTTNAGKGSLKISFPVSNTTVSTVLFASVGALTSGKTYVLNFTTLGTTAGGQFVASLRQTASPNNLLASQQTVTFGTSRVDHKIIFTATASDANGRFDISIKQNSGTTYVDNIAFFETNTAGDLVGDNLYAAASGQFETGITGISIWSSNGNQLAEWDVTAKISSTNYYTVADATGKKSTVGIIVYQPAIKLLAASSAPSIAATASTTTVTVSATGGRAPYSGTGNFTVGVGTFPYTVTDANGCTSSTSVTVIKLLSRPTNAAAIVITNTTNSDSDNFTAKAYPNPSTSDFTVQVNGGAIAEKILLQVMSYDGRVVFQSTGLTNSNYNFGRNFIAGVYTLKLIQGHSLKSIKLIKAVGNK